MNFNDDIKQNLTKRWSDSKQYFKCTHNTSKFITLMVDREYGCDLMKNYCVWRTRPGEQKIFTYTTAAEAYFVIVDKSKTTTNILYSYLTLDFPAVVSTVGLIVMYFFLSFCFAILSLDAIGPGFAILVVGISLLGLFVFLKNEKNIRSAQILHLLKTNYPSLFLYDKEKLK